MLVLITYDVNTENAAGKARLRKVAKQCVNYGRRVQNSVFECILDNAQSIALKATLEDIIDTEKDSLRFYYLGNKYQTKIEYQTNTKQCLFQKCKLSFRYCAPPSALQKLRQQIIDNNTAAHDPQITWIEIAIKPERHEDQCNLCKDWFSEFMQSIIATKCQWKKNKYKYVRIK